MGADTPEEPEDTKYVFEANVRAMERTHDFMRELMKRVSDATVQSGQLAARMIIFVNGGAIVAMLAFVGNFAGKGVSLGAVADSLFYFAAGVIAGTVTIGATYFSNFSGATCLYSYDLTGDHPYIKENRKVVLWRRTALSFSAVAMLSGIAGLVLFAWGTWEIKDAIKALV